MSEHTPGPWIVFVDRSSGEERYDILPAGRDGEIAHNIANSADADLIRAAPKMLEALKEIAEGRGAFDRDPLKHASNCIDDMKMLALEAIAEAEVALSSALRKE